MTTSNDEVTTTNQILSHQNILDEMNSAISDLEPLLPITSEQRQLLLLKFNWDIESLKNSLQEYANTNSFMIENGVCPKNTVSVVKKSECEVCCASKRLLGLRCRHMACFNCWGKYLAAKIRDDKCVLLKCIEFGCEILISNEMLETFLCCSKLEAAHRGLIEESYVNSHSSLAWCNKKCGMTVRRLNKDDVTCSCGSTFCISCKSDAHYPATCRQISLTTRECPRCFIPNQKSGRRNRMTCAACRYQYCWVCLKNWRTHSLKCKQYDIAIAQSRRNSRGIFHLSARHFDRYEHHKKCLKHDPRVFTELKIQNTLDDCRRFLMNSYIFGYYLKNGQYKNCLEEHQCNLEIVVEELAVFKNGRRASKLAEDCLILRKVLLDHCSCRNTLCILCESDAHYPATCRQLQLWEERRSNSNGMTLSWIRLNTKECPKCFIPIQKNDGCNHMTCTGCRYQYCWVCLKNWRTHFGGCKQSDITKEQSRLNPRGTSDVFAQHVARFDHHERCLEREQRVASKFKFRSTLAECRHNLMNSYVFGYYLKNGMYTITLEKHQQNLEIAVGKLASKLNVCYQDNIEILKSGRKVLKLDKECLTLRKALLDHCAEGVEHEDLEGRQHVKIVTINKLDCGDFCGEGKEQKASDVNPYDEKRLRGPVQSDLVLLLTFLLAQLPLQFPTMITLNDGFVLVSSSPKKAPFKETKPVDFPISNEVLSNHNILAEVNSAIFKLEPLLPITPEQRQLLLLKFNWDIESLKNSLQESTDTNSFLIENGVCPESTVSVIKKSECEVCCATKRLLGLRCQHMACFNCWGKYLAAKIRDDKCVLLECIEFGCGMLISNEMLEKFLCCSKLETAHRGLIEDSYVNSDSRLSWCNRKCGKAVRRSNCDTVICSCGSVFCFLCKSDAHYPATCLQFRLWDKKHMNPNQETASWILLNTRECPRCFTPIQKSGGCNRITCTACRYQFCWVCSQNLVTHSKFCVKYDIDMAQFRRKSRRNSHFFARHVDRYEHHKKCLKQDPRGLTELKIQNTLDECRRILMNSFVFGYYMKDGIYKNRVECSQNELERAVEELAHSKIGRRASKLAENCLKRRKTLLYYCAEAAAHENLEGLQPAVKRVTTDKHDCGDFCVIFILAQQSLMMATSHDENTTTNQILSHQKILSEINSAVSQFEPLLPLTPGQRELLLLKFNWNLDSLRNSFQEYADTNKFLLENGICPKSVVSVIKKSECGVCCSKGKSVGLRCRHMACLDCWSEYLAAKIRDDQSVLGCMEYGCNALISNEMLGKFVNNPKFLHSYQKIVIDSYVKSNPNITWCNKKCGKAVKGSNSDTVICSCGPKFCFSCGSDPHLPATCRQIQLWNKKRTDNESRKKPSDGKSLSWVMANTKDCPRCGVTIEKRPGCNHVLCTIKHCRLHFCWTCGQDLLKHGMSCNAAHIAAEQSRMKSRASFHVFAQHLLRFEQQEQLLKSERLEHSALNSAKTLVDCRRVLMHSYVFEYYLKQESYHAKVFEKHQSKLEKAVKNLSKLLEENQEFENSEVRKLAAECRKFLKSLLDHCAKGKEYEDLRGRQSNAPFLPAKVCVVFKVLGFLLVVFFVLFVICTVFYWQKQ
ncbi:unnamed protein product [Caenorhabditis brenneri]